MKWKPMTGIIAAAVLTASGAVAEDKETVLSNVVSVRVARRRFFRQARALARRNEPRPETEIEKEIERKENNNESLSK